MNSMFSLEGKTALVTGGGRGIGRAIAVAFAQCGADVALASRTEAELQETAALVEAAGQKATTFPVDLSQSGEAARLVEAVMEKWGSLDILATSSGTIVRKPAFDMSEAEWDSMIDLNLKARFFLSKAAASHMKEKGGSLIHIASLSTFFGIPNQMPYVAGNGGLAALVRAQAVEWADLNIRSNAIAPGSILTRQTEKLLANPEMRASRLNKIPMNRFGEPEDIAGAAVFLASNAAAYVTGHVLVVDGGWLAAGGGMKG